MEGGDCRTCWRLAEQSTYYILWTEAERRGGQVTRPIDINNVALVLKDMYPVPPEWSSFRVHPLLVLAPKR